MFGAHANKVAHYFAQIHKAKVHCTPSHAQRSVLPLNLQHHNASTFTRSDSDNANENGQDRHPNKLVLRAASAAQMSKHSTNCGH